MSVFSEVRGRSANYSCGSHLAWGLGSEWFLNLRGFCKNKKSKKKMLYGPSGMSPHSLNSLPLCRNRLWVPGRDTQLGGMSE